MRSLYLSGLCVLLAACAAPVPREQPAAPSPPPPASSSSSSLRAAAQPAAPKVVPVSPAQASGAPAGSTRARALAHARAQQTQKPISASYRCSFRNETGYNGSSSASIEAGVVRALATRVEVPGRGSCDFAWGGFRQTQTTPSIELVHADRCTVRVWQQGQQLTVSYSNCAARCTGEETFKYVWPVLVDLRRGRCD